MASASVPDTFAVLKLDKPIDFKDHRGVDSVELIMEEDYFVQYGLYTGKTVKVTCDLVETARCDYIQHEYPKVACAVVHMEIEP